MILMFLLHVLRRSVSFRTIGDTTWRLSRFECTGLSVHMRTWALDVSATAAFAVHRSLTLFIGDFLCAGLEVVSTPSWKPLHLEETLVTW